MKADNVINRLQAIKLQRLSSKTPWTSWWRI